MAADCRYGSDCRAFKRLSNRGNRLGDRCHVRVYAHPPRDHYAKLPPGYTPFVYRKKRRHTRVPEPGLSDDEQLARLITEVKRNGYGEDLETAEGELLLEAVVDRKMKHRRCRQVQAELARQQELTQQRPLNLCM